MAGARLDRPLPHRNRDRSCGSTRCLSAHATCARKSACAYRFERDSEYKRGKMIQEFVDRFEARKDLLRSKWSEKHPASYAEIVKEVVALLSEEDEYGKPDPENIKELDFGDYQGTLVYVIPERGYQPSD